MIPLGDAYLLIFGVGTIAGMMLITAAIAVRYLLDAISIPSRSPRRGGRRAKSGFRALPRLPDRLRRRSFHEVKPGATTPATTMSRERVRIVVRGAVQGVGFRPFVYRLATELGLNGWVVNSAQGVFVEIEGASDPFRVQAPIENRKTPRAIIQSSNRPISTLSVTRNSKSARALIRAGKVALIFPGYRDVR